jgi:hypothetical protein
MGDRIAIALFCVVILAALPGVVIWAIGPVPTEVVGLVVWTISIELIVLVGLPALVMWAASRFIGRRTAIAIGMIAAAFVLYMMVASYWTCQAPPIFVPSGGSTWEAAIFPCDAPAGVLIHLFIWGIGPTAVAMLLALAFFHYVKFRRYQ